MLIDPQGDRKPDYDMAILNNGTWITMFEYIPSNQSIQFVTTDVLWSAGVSSPPKGRPPCGWNKELCPTNSELKLVASLVYRKSSCFCSTIILIVTINYSFEGNMVSLC